MINSLNARVQEINQDNLVVVLGGIGLQVFVPAPFAASLNINQEIFLYTHLLVREDSLTLYGFESRLDREMFILLLAVNGVGPKLALAILSTLSTDTIRQAVYQEQVEVLNRVPGVGKKTAQKILLHLQDRISKDTSIQPMDISSDIDSEVLAALTSLGYSVVEAQSALQSIPRTAPQDVETRLRLALQYFS
jgi:holliday junction DNA helicase RuvA